MTVQRDSRVTCYMCDAPAEGLEHAPPRCLFPKGRANLIQVPACAQHNQAKSRDDEYLACFLALNAEGSAVADSLFEGSRIRSMRRRDAALGKRVFSHARPVSTVSGHLTLAVSYEVERISHVVGCAARALYFHQTKNKWLHACTVVCPRMQLDSVAIEEFRRSAQMLGMIDALHNQGDSNGKVYGDHPDVVWYQVVHTRPRHPLIRLNFYGSVDFLVVGRL